MRLLRKSAKNTLFKVRYLSQNLAIRNNTERVPIENFEKNIYAALKIAKKHTEDVSLLGILTINSTN